MKLCLSPILALLLCAACNAPSPSSRSSAPAASAPAVASAKTEAASLVSTPHTETQVAATSVAVALPSAAVKRAVAVTSPSQAGVSALKVKRFVVATGVEDREPTLGGEALPADGSPIYAFAELANPAGPSENVRITFERKGGAERVGDVTLPIPANTPRHRTWAFTRYIRTAGVWEAVLWSESGAELGRTSFEVTAS